jgi:2-C-methyl-D-erythritol 4-phosphate cytidylyltransferase
MKSAAVIVAGGTGRRIGAGIPKQFICVGGKPILLHTIEKFSHVNECIVVLPEHEIETWRTMVKQYDFQVPHTVVAGGSSRYLSVKNGLAAVKFADVVAVHDGARPLVSRELIDRCLKDAFEFGSAIPVISVPESIRSHSNTGSTAEDRSRFLLVQTPQCFKTAYISSAYNKPDDSSFTDDATVLEKNGVAVHLTEGERWNIKITFPEDIAVAEALLSDKKSDK